MSSDNKALVRQWFEEVWNNGRAEVIDQLLASDAKVYGLAADAMDVNAFKVFYAAYRNAFPNLKIHIDEMIEEGDLVALRWTASGTHLGGGLGFPATNKAARFTGMGFIRARGGKFVEGWNVFDQLGMLQQLGVVQAPV